MSAVGELVFSRARADNNNDIWDDTALIKAYDDAVSTMKMQLAVKLEEDKQDKDEAKQNEPKKKHKKNRRKDCKRDKSASQRSTGGLLQWCVGDHCRAVYTEDGQVYEAVIISTDQKADTCRVRFLGYGNEEDQRVTDLLPTRESRPGSRVQSECDSMDWSQFGPRVTPQPGGATSMRGPTPPGVRGPAPSGMDRGWAPPAPPPPFMTMGPPMMGDMAPPTMPPLFPPMMGLGVPPFSNLPNPLTTPMGFPHMPFPPHLDDNDDDDDNDEHDSGKGAFHSMLISWYMSGYHTGYYQGLKQGKKPASKDKSSHRPSAAEAHHTDDNR